jgi:hypothetical protein
MMCATLWLHVAYNCPAGAPAAKACFGFQAPVLSRACHMQLAVAFTVVTVHSGCTSLVPFPLPHLDILDHLVNQLLNGDTCDTLPSCQPDLRASRLGCT